MPLGKNVRYVTTKGGVRLAIRGGSRKRRTGTIVEAKNLKTGAVHTPAEFAADRRRRRRKRTRSTRVPRGSISDLLQRRRRKRR